MIITKIEDLREVPAGEKVTLVLDFQIVKTDLNAKNPCGGCIFHISACDICTGCERDDGQEVKFIKV